MEDIAKRLADFGYHAPTVSWPEPGAIMIEPTESESKYELDKFCDAMLAIEKEIARIAAGEWPRENNPLVCAPHVAEDVFSDDWNRPYSREEAVYPVAWMCRNKYWPPVSRIDAAFGDRNINALVRRLRPSLRKNIKQPLVLNAALPCKGAHKDTPLQRVLRRFSLHDFRRGSAPKRRLGTILNIILYRPRHLLKSEPHPNFHMLSPDKTVSRHNYL